MSRLTQSADELLPLVYDQLRQLAAARLAKEGPGLTLQPTALVHEAYLRLSEHHCSASWWGRGPFFAAAAEAMRRILVDYARKRRAIKAGGQYERSPWDESLAVTGRSPVDLVELDEALEELQQHHPTAAELVKLRFFAGFSHEEAASLIQVERRAADRLWALARAWLYRRLSAE